MVYMVILTKGGKEMGLQAVYVEMLIYERLLDAKASMSLDKYREWAPLAKKKAVEKNMAATRSTMPEKARNALNGEGSIAPYIDWIMSDE